MQRPSRRTLYAAAVETQHTSSESNGATPARKRGVNLARWLVKEPDSVARELKGYSQGFLQFWRQRRATYWSQVADARKVFDARPTTSNDNDESHEHFRPPMLQQIDEAGYADKAFIREVLKYGEMVQAVYDTLETKDVLSRFFGRCKPGAMVVNTTLDATNHKLINVGEAAAKYTIVSQLEADSGAYKLVIKEGRNYVGFIAEGPADSSESGDSKQMDIAVVFRGTITPDEWLQDAKVLQVRWNKGSEVAKSPRIFLRALPFQPTSGAFTRTLVLSLLLLWAVKVKTGALPAGVAAVDHWVGSMLSAAGSAAGSVPAGFLQGLVLSGTSFVEGLLGVTLNAASGPLPFSVALATAVWLVNGLLRARAAHPNHWLQDLLSLVMSVGPWVAYGTRLLADTFVSSFAALKGDPLISYGFKQMYADAKDNADTGSQQLPASPRLTILVQLTVLLQKYRKQGKIAHSIHVTGHSLGGALASLCAYDLSTTVAEAMEAHEDPINSIPYKELKGKEDLYSKTAAQRICFMSEIWKIKKEKGDEAVPVVAGITFAAPRVGNAAYANAFAGRSLIDPLSMKEPLLDSGYNPSMGGRLGALFRDRIWLWMKSFWYKAGMADIAKDDALRAAKHAMLKKISGAAAPRVMGGMLRVVNVHDVVPALPSAVRVPFYRYVHGGQELLVNSLHVPYYKAGPFTGAAVGARHSLEQYLHTLSPTRDQALVNKGDDLLLSGYCVPSSWWSPVPNRGMVYDDTVKGRGVWMRQEALDELKGKGE